MSNPVERIKRFIDARTGMRGLDPNIVHSINTNGEQENLTLPDLRALLADLERAEKALTALAQQAQPVFLVATGEIYEGEETYQRFEGIPPPLCDFEVLYTTQPAPPVPAPVDDVLTWAVSRWEAEVKNRPLINKNRRPLDDAWRQVVRFAGGDPEKLLGPSHDELLGQSQAPQTKGQQ